MQSLRIASLSCKGDDPLRESSLDSWHGCSGVQTQLLLGDTPAAAVGDMGLCPAIPSGTGGSCAASVSTDRDLPPTPT